MPSDIYGGTEGQVSANGFNGDMDAWTAEIEVQETTWRPFASRWQKRKNVAYGGTGQFQGTIQFNSSDTQPMPANGGGDVDAASFEAVSITLTAEEGCTISGTANITGISLNRPANDRMSGTWRFSFDGEVQITWDEGA